MLVLLSLRVAGGVDALGRRKACCRRAVTLVDLLLLLCATRKDCSLLCAMHETIVVFTVDFSLMHLAFGSYSICLPGGVACGSVCGARAALARKTLS